MKTETKELSQIQILPMTEADLDKVIELGFSTPEFQTGTDAAQFYSRKTLERWVQHKDGVTLVAKSGNEVAGFFLGYYMEGPNDGYMNCIAVAEKFRKQGVGSQLLEEALSRFEQKGTGDIKCDRVFGMTEVENQEAIQVLEKHGIQKGRKFYYMEIMLPRTTGGATGLRNDILAV